MPVRVLLVDDADGFRVALRARLELEEGVVVVAEGRNGVQGIELAKVHTPEVAVVDHQMPLMTGLQCIPLLKAASPKTIVILLTSESAPEVRRAAMAVGAHAFLSKSDGVDNCARLVRGLFR